MHLPAEYRRWILDIVQTDAFQQIAPLVVLILIPLLAVCATPAIKRTSATFLALAATTMSFLPSWLPWGGGSQGAGASGKHSKDRKKIKKARTRAEQIQMNGLVKKGRDSSTLEDEDGYYPGLVNISGTYCFMNSTLQALASLSYLHPHIDALQRKAEALDVPTPVVDALKDLLTELNTPRSAYRSIRPLDIIRVLTVQTEKRANSLFNSREHQDAQELFQVVSECLKNELAAVDKEGARDRGFGGLALSNEEEETKEIGKSVFDGLTANRRSCVICGYTEAVMHFSFDSWQLSVPRLATSCRLEDCLEDYTRLEILKDCICRKCSMVATHTRLQKELSTLEAATAPPAKPSTSKKKRLKEVRKMEARVKAALEEGRIEDDLKDVRIEKVFSTASTKQAMIARPPPVLALHLNRSIHFGTYAGKNTCRVGFPEVLDLTPYTTSGSLSTIPTASISTPPPANPMPRRSTTPTPSLYRGMEATRTIYRLSAVVCHFGTHSFGHYICYRRKPTGRKGPPKLVDPLLLRDASVSSSSMNTSVGGKGKGVEGEGEGAAGDDKEDKESKATTEEEEEDQGPEYVWDDGTPPPGTGWLRISDDSVRECGIETVLTEGAAAFMLYYELAVRDPLHVYPSSLLHAAGMGLGEMGVRGVRGAEASEETLKPEMRAVYLNGSVGSLVSEVGVGVQKRKAEVELERERERDKERDRERERDSVSSAISIPGSMSMSIPMSMSMTSSLASSSLSTSPPADRTTDAGKGLSMSVPSIGLSGALTRASSAQARVVRSVAAGRGRSTSVQPASPSPSSVRTQSAGPSNVGASSSSSSSLPSLPSSPPSASSIPEPREGSKSTVVVMQEDTNGSAMMSASVPTLPSTLPNGTAGGGSKKGSPKKKGAVKGPLKPSGLSQAFKAAQEAEVSAADDVPPPLPPKVPLSSLNSGEDGTRIHAPLPVHPPGGGVGGIVGSLDEESKEEGRGS